MPIDVPVLQRLGPRARWWVVTAFLELALFWFTFVGLTPHGTFFLDVPHILPACSIAVVGIALLLRSRWPIVFFIVAAAASLLALYGQPVPFPGFGFQLGIIFAIYTVSAITPLRWALVVAASVCVAQLSIIYVVRGVEPVSLFPAITVASIALATTLGQMARDRRLLVNATAQRAIEAERTREAEAERRVAEDRLATARALHDAVGHQVAAINLNAGAAAQALGTRPDDARLKLEAVQGAAAEVLTQIGGLLDELRPAATSREDAGAEKVARRVAELRSAGIVVRDEGFHPPQSWAAHQRETTYRIVDEALFNAHKYGAPGEPITLYTTTESDLVHVVVDNRISEQPKDVPSTGHGIYGIQERALSLNGTATVARRGDHFVLDVALPLRERSR